MEDLADDDPVELVPGLADLVEVRDALAGVVGEAQAALIPPLYMPVGCTVGVVHARVHLGHPGIAVVVLLDGVVAVPALEQADHVLGPVAPPVHAHGVLGHRGVGLEEYSSRVW